MREKDFSRVLIKINTAGSWANLIVCRAADFEQAKAACEALAATHLGSIKFRALDADGGVIEQYGPTKPSGVTCWHEP